MKIFANTDTFKELAVNTRNELVGAADDLDIEVVQDISKADIVFSIGGDRTFQK